MQTAPSGGKKKKQTVFGMVVKQVSNSLNNYSHLCSFFCLVLAFYLPLPTLINNTIRSTRIDKQIRSQLRDISFRFNQTWEMLLLTCRD